MTQLINVTFPDPAANTDAVFTVRIAPFKRFRIAHINCSVANADASTWQVNLRAGDTSNTGRIRFAGPTIAAGVTATYSASIDGPTINAGSNGEVAAVALPSIWFTNDTTLRLSPNGAAAYQITAIQLTLEAQDD